jgi:hypothetical protein
MRAIGYHGTSVERAERILVSGFQASRNDYDWLGDGVYFFQDAPLRAWEWATERFAGDAAVVGAEIDLAGCVDLLDIAWERPIANAHERFLRYLAQTGADVPRQTRGAHRLDRRVLNYLVTNANLDGLEIRTIRGVFAEGPPIFPGSALLIRAHVQIAVRDTAAIVRTWRVTKEA